MASHLVQGREVTLPVEIRDATVCAVVYTVRADAARAVLAYSPDMDVTEFLPGKALCVLQFIRYDDGDLGSYNEFGVGFMVRPPDTRGRAAGNHPDAFGPSSSDGPGRFGPTSGNGPAAFVPSSGHGSGALVGRPRTATGTGVLSGVRGLRGAGMFVHWLPVDQRFTLEAGRTIWGFPKEMAEIDLRLSSPYKRCILRKDGRLVLDLLIRPGMPIPAPSADLTAYTHLDGTTRRIRCTARPQTIHARPGGALIRLGNHPIAKELSELGLPKHALLTTTITHTTATIPEAEPLPRI
ncbi:acetoacetate decarboxylase [Sphaerisporangium siamense]|uniref:Acetoacetate decarboxylase n=1 Tax=Sphaerisporangium siamense TaxID=795645 RepID=A0A7W7GDR3_9ACTN|nr:acetoacetate decarboxylase family protein [Sphaerisporangium siamense]MBB4705892.1 hypothetical protein [Sphaerisporangium siamense]GII82714.1 acetoacetate decarboxylase [Sphaerisporangium siamense]